MVTCRLDGSLRFWGGCDGCDSCSRGQTHSDEGLRAPRDVHRYRSAVSARLEWRTAGITSCARGTDRVAPAAVNGRPVPSAVREADASAAIGGEATYLRRRFCDSAAEAVGLHDLSPARPPAHCPAPAVRVNAGDRRGEPEVLRTASISVTDRRSRVTAKGGRLLLCDAAGRCGRRRRSLCGVRCGRSRGPTWRPRRGFGRRAFA
jgi:hypothetical protein